jgi:hypothetical protein
MKLVLQIWSYTTDRWSLAQGVKASVTKKMDSELEFCKKIIHLSLSAMEISGIGFKFLLQQFTQIPMQVVQMRINESKNLLL